MSSIDDMKMNMTSEKLGINDIILKELWDKGIWDELDSSGHAASSRFYASMRAFEARLSALQDKRLQVMTVILERNEESSKRTEKSTNQMKLATYVMIIVAFLTFLVASEQVYLSLRANKGTAPITTPIKNKINK